MQLRGQIERQGFRTTTVSCPSYRKRADTIQLPITGLRRACIGLVYRLRYTSKAASYKGFCNSSRSCIGGVSPQADTANYKAQVAKKRSQLYRYSHDTP